MSAAGRLVAIVCSAQVFVQLGAGYWPVLLPELMGRWSLSNSEAGWITSAFYAAYMVSVPVLAATQVRNATPQPRSAFISSVCTQ